MPEGVRQAEIAHVWAVGLGSFLDRPYSQDNLLASWDGDTPFLQSQISVVLNASFSGGANFPTVTVWRCYQESNVWHNHIIEGFYIFESMKELTHFVCHFMKQAISIHESIAPFYDTIKKTGHFFP